MAETRTGRPPGINRMEQHARRTEALALVAALRVIARDLEALAWRDDALACVGQADRLRDVASRYERKWTPNEEGIAA